MSEPIEVSAALDGKPSETDEQNQEAVSDVKIFGAGETADSVAGAKSLRHWLFMAALAVAIICIAIGAYNSWAAFREFDDTILGEKDSQLLSLIASEDINIENSLESFCREADMFLARQRLDQLRKDWLKGEEGSADELREFISDNNLVDNPVYADLLVLRDSSVEMSASGSTDYVFRTEADGRGLRIASDGRGGHYMAYEMSAKGGVRYEALISLDQLYVNALSGSTSRGIMLMDAASTLVVRQKGTDIIIETPAEEQDDNIRAYIDYLTECQGSQASGGRFFEYSRPDGDDYTARMVVQPSGRTTNGEFAIGIAADIDEALRPSRNAARKILIYGGMSVGGVILLIFMLIFMRRVNTANETELELLKKKNTTMAELNQNMQALAHHQRLETIGTMTASIAHDFNNLLTPIMGYSIMAAEMLPDDQAEIQDYMMEVYNASVKAKDIVQRLADLSKKGKEESFRDLDPVEIIRSSLKVTLPAKPKNVEVRGRFSSGSARMRGDSTQISQLVINIVLNAYDAMRESGGTLTVSTRIEDGWVAMRFKDTGTGMDAETLARIFDPFYTTKESGKGTGLGLAIVHQICDTHGGKVYVDSEPGAGTEFRINFPMIEEEEFAKGATKVIRSSEIRERLDQKEEY